MGLGTRGRFLDQLKQLRVEAGSPKQAELIRQMPAVLNRTNVSELLNGKGPVLPPWERIKAFVIACVRAGIAQGRTMPPEESLLDQWRKRYDALAVAVDLSAPGGPGAQAMSKEVDRGGGTLFEAARADDEQATQLADWPEWWLRSGYVEQVGDIAPLELLDRQDELAELATWCTDGNEGYVWWRAEVKAGKSALMAWFVLHPPPGVWLVSFFVTARYAGQADSSAFTDALLEQLTGITGELIPPLTSAAARDRHRRRLLSEAASRAVKAGRRLVLVVDGLDEDCGSQPGSGLPSIAACLPKRLPKGLRVIVSGRPDPPIPADVDADHPLRQSCRIRPLSASPHATRVTELAQRELDEVLTSDQQRDDGLGHQVLGLVTASGGGLDRHDLHHLSGRPVFEIDRLLHGVFGRTIAGRVDPHTTQRVFMFTHETLREQANDRLGPDTLADFATRLHAWAAGYQQQGWPADTPTYLLRGYPRMLGDAQDIKRLVALATDADRHRWMLNATGGGALALAEVVDTTNLICREDEPDLAALLLLAVRKDALAENSRYLPVNLPAVWAAVGETARAVSLAQGITDLPQRVAALSRIVSTSVTSGDLVYGDTVANAAEQAAHSIENSYLRARVLCEYLVTRWTAIGWHDRAAALVTSAKAAIQSITNPERRARILRELASALATAGDRTFAPELAVAAADATSEIVHPKDHARALHALVPVLVTAGHSDRAIGLTPAIRRIEDPSDRARALGALATALAEAGRCHQAAQLVAEITSSPARAQVLAALFTAWSAVGDQDQAAEAATGAEAALDESAGLYLHEQIVSAVAAAFAMAGDGNRAERLIRSTTEGFHSVMALAAVVPALVAANDRDRAIRLFNEFNSPWHPRLLTALAQAFAATGDQARTLPLVNQIDDPDDRARVLCSLVIAQATAGDTDPAVALITVARSAVREMTKPQDRSRLMADLGAVFADAGLHNEAAELVLNAEAMGRDIPNTHNHDWTHIFLVTGLIDGGDLARAERLARQISDVGHRANSICELVVAYAEKGDLDRATELAVVAEAATRELENDPDHYPVALGALASALIVAGDYPGAERLANEIDDQWTQEHVFEELATARTPERVDGSTTYPTTGTAPRDVTNSDDRVRPSAGRSAVLVNAGTQNSSVSSSRRDLVEKINADHWEHVLSEMGRIDLPALQRFCDLLLP